MSPSKIKNYAVILAGGVSKRMGDMSLPKHFLEICGIHIIVLTIQNIINSSLSYFCL